MTRARISIRGKLIAVTLLAILAPISCVLVLVGNNEIRDIRSDMLTSSVLITSVVAEYGAAALAFDSRPAAEEALQVLGENPRFLDAAIYDRSRRLFASFRRPNGGADAPPPPSIGDAAPRSALEGARITVVYPIAQGGERFGTLVLHSAIAPLTSRVHAYLWGLWWLTLGVIASSLTLAWALERMVTRRLYALADVARQVARRGDYSARATERGTDEIALLAQAFNGMLAEIEQRQAEAREAVRLRDEFLSVASHELKTPLTSLKLRVQSLCEHAPPIPDPVEAARLQKSVDLAERQVRRLEKLVNNLLDVSRIAVGRFWLQREEIDLVAVVHNVAGQFSAELARSSSELTLELPANAFGLWDPMRLEQVVVNLLSNAIKYGAGQPIVVRVELDGGNARLIVRDRGIGIAIADQARIFERFERAVSLDYGGLGLGLHITSEIVRAHGGTIRVESGPAAGSAFIVELPRAYAIGADLGASWS
ncbi:MAG TPA: ATP-binding protein [Polyangia bacterium]|jgi:signal transduction histidine kinase